MRGILSLPLAFLAGAALTSSRLAAFDALHIALCAVGLFLALLAYQSSRPRATARHTAPDPAATASAAAADVAAQLLSPEGLSARTRVLMQELDARTWLDTSLKAVWRKYNPAMSLWLKNYLEVYCTDALASSLPGFVKSLSWARVELGASPPAVLRTVPVRVVDQNSLVLDLEIEHASELRIAADVGLRTGIGVGVSIPFLLRDLVIAGTLRVQIGLVDRRPYAGTISFSFMQQPKLDFSLSLVSAVDLAQAPLLGSAIRTALDDALASRMTWPQKMTLPLDAWFHPLESSPRVADGVLRVRVLCAQRLPAADLTGYSNPFVILSLGDHRAKSAVRTQTLQPVWSDEFCLLVPDRRTSVLRLQVLDFNPTKVHDLLGTAELRLSDVHPAPRTAWLRLEMPRNSKQAEWLVTCSSKSYDKATEAARIAVQVVYSSLTPIAAPPAAPRAPAPPPATSIPAPPPPAPPLPAAPTQQEPPPKQKGVAAATSGRPWSVWFLEQVAGAVGGNRGQREKQAAAAAFAPAHSLGPLKGDTGGGGMGPGVEGQAGGVPGGAVAMGEPPAGSGEAVPKGGPDPTAIPKGGRAQPSIPLGGPGLSALPAAYRLHSDSEEGELAFDEMEAGSQGTPGGIEGTAGPPRGIEGSSGSPGGIAGRLKEGGGDDDGHLLSGRAGGVGIGGGAGAPLSVVQGVGVGVNTGTLPLPNPTLAATPAVASRASGGWGLCLPWDTGGGPAARGPVAIPGAARSVPPDASIPSGTISGEPIPGRSISGVPVSIPGVAEDPIASELGMTEERWAELYQNGTIVLKSGCLLKSNRRHNNYRERWAELELSLENDHTQPGASTAPTATTVSAQLRYYKLEMPSGGWNPLRGAFAALDSVLDFLTLSALATAPAISRETAEQFGRRCQGTIRIDADDFVNEGAWQRVFLCAAPQVVCLRKPSRLWYLRASGGREGRSWLKALHLSRALVSNPDTRQRLVATARRGFEARAAGGAAGAAMGTAVTMAGEAAVGDGGGAGGAATSGANPPNSGHGNGGGGAGGGGGGTLPPTGTTLMPAGSSGHSGGAAVRVADLNGTAVEGPVEGVVLLVELLEARALDAIDPLGGCNPYAVIQIGTHEVQSEPLYDTTEPQWGRAWELWGGARDRRYTHLCGGFLAAIGMLTVRIESERRNGGIDSLGSASLPLSRLLLGPCDAWLPLQFVSTGQVHLRVTPYSVRLPALNPIPHSLAADLLLNGPPPPHRTRNHAPNRRAPPLPSAGAEPRVGGGGGGRGGRMHSMPARQHTIALELELLGAASGAHATLGTVAGSTL